MKKTVFPCAKVFMILDAIFQIILQTDFIFYIMLYSHYYKCYYQFCNSNAINYRDDYG